VSVTVALNVVNIALGHLGAKKLAALDNTTEHGLLFNLLYPESRDELLREMRPNFAKKRAIFHQVVDAEKTITGATAASPVVITSAAHGFSDDDVVAIWDVAGMTDLNGKMYIVQNAAVNTFELTDVNGQEVDGEDFDAWTSGGKCGLVSDAPAFGYSNRYALPSDYILLLELNGNEDLTIPHSVEGGELLSDEQEIQARYVRQVTDVTAFDKDFVKILSYKLAEAAFAVTNQKSVQELWEGKYEKELSRGKGRKSQESGSPQSGPPRQVVCNRWTNARRRGS
jgi:hypothetical protein